MHKCVVDEQVFPLIIERKPRDETSFFLRSPRHIHYFLIQNKGINPKQHLP